MVSHKITYTFSGKTWRYTGKGGWYFVSLPLELSDEIRRHLKWMEEGWGRIQVTAHIGQSKWDSAIWFDTKKNTYLLPLKSSIRASEGIDLDQLIDVSIKI